MKTIFKQLLFCVSAVVAARSASYFLIVDLGASALDVVANALTGVGMMTVLLLADWRRQRR